MAEFVLETERLRLRQLAEEDAGFILQLVNDPAWLRFIGDRGVRSLRDARRYIVQGAQAMYATAGFGLWLVEIASDGRAAGICGLLRRAGLDDPDIGFAYLPEFRGQGYALEAASAVMEHARTVLGLKRVLAITSPFNHSSIRLLDRIGLKLERMIRLPGGDEDLKLYARQF